MVRHDKKKLKKYFKQRNKKLDRYINSNEEYFERDQRFLIKQLNKLLFMTRVQYLLSMFSCTQIIVSIEKNVIL